jgi:hypothetical protein
MLGAGHLSQPLACVPLLQSGTGRQLLAGQRPMFGKMLEEIEPISDDAHEEGAGPVSYYQFSSIRRPGARVGHLPVKP